jgi:ABC-type amino acid transport substrate-binding protein
VTPARLRIVGLLAVLILGLSGLAQAQDVLRVATDPTFPAFEYSEGGKREPELLAQFNDALEKLKADGTYQQLLNKYL